MVYCRNPSHAACLFSFLLSMCVYAVGVGSGRGRVLCISEDISRLEKYAAAVHTLSETPHNLTFSRTALHSAKVADVVNQFSLPQTVIASYKSHHIAWNGRISSRALLQCVFRILLNESPSVPSCWLPRKHLLSHLPLFHVCLTPLPRGNKKIKSKRAEKYQFMRE